MSDKKRKVLVAKKKAAKVYPTITGYLRFTDVVDSDNVIAAILQEELLQSGDSGSVDFISPNGLESYLKHLAQDFRTGAYADGLWLLELPSMKVIKLGVEMAFYLKDSI